MLVFKFLMYHIYKADELMSEKETKMAKLNLRKFSLKLAVWHARSIVMGRE
jgi:hypothetical protein